MESTGTDMHQMQAVTDLIRETERRYEDYLRVAVVADLAQLSHDAPILAPVTYAGPPPVGLVVTSV